MSQNLAQPQQEDKTIGKYVPQGYYGEPRIVADDEDELPNVAYEPPARGADEARVVTDTPQFREDELTDVAKQLLSLDIEQGEVTSTSTEAPQTEQKETEPELEYKPEDVDYSYLELSDSIPELNVNETDPDFQQWVQGFEKYLGHDWETYKKSRTDLREAYKLKAEAEKVKQQRNLEQQTNYIKQKWGVDDKEYHRRMQVVVQEFSKLDPVTQRLLDRDPNGALKLWKDIQMREGSNKPEVPQYEKSRPTAMSGETGKKPMFTGSQIESMPENQRAALWGKIMSASQQGLVDWSK